MSSETNLMAFINNEMTIMMKEYDTDECLECDECIGCETGVDYIGAHLNENGNYNKFCCTSEADAERKILNK